MDKTTKGFVIAASAVVIGCGAIFVMNAAEQKRIADVRFCSEWYEEAFKSYDFDTLIKLPQFKGQENRIRKCMRESLGQ